MDVMTGIGHLHMYCAEWDKCILQSAVQFHHKATVLVTM